MNRTKYAGVFFIMAFLMINLTGCKNDSSSGSPTSSGGGTLPPGKQKPFSGDIGKLSGDWTGTNSLKKGISFTVKNGIILSYSNDWGTSGVKIQSFTEGIPIDPKTGLFDGYFGSIRFWGIFYDDNSAVGQLQNISDLDAPVMTWIAKLKTGKPDDTKYRVDVQKWGLGIVETTTGQRICEENEFQCNADFTPGTELTLRARALSPLYEFIHWGIGACGGSNETCEVTMDEHKSIQMDFDSFQEINVDGTYTGTTEQGRPVTVSVQDNIVTVVSKVVIGPSNCVMDVNITDTSAMYYSSFFQDLSFYISHSEDLAVYGGFSTPTSVQATISMDTTEKPGVSAGCRGTAFVDFSIGGGIAVSSLSAGNNAQEKQARKNEAMNRRR